MIAEVSAKGRSGAGYLSAVYCNIHMVSCKGPKRTRVDGHLRSDNGFAGLRPVIRVAIAI
jgi:hypothetical protein